MASLFMNILHFVYTQFRVSCLPIHSMELYSTPRLRILADSRAQLLPSNVILGSHWWVKRLSLVTTLVSGILTQLYWSVVRTHMSSHKPAGTTVNARNFRGMHLPETLPGHACFQYLHAIVDNLKFGAIYTV